MHLPRWAWSDRACFWTAAELGYATGDPSPVRSCSFTNQALAQLDILKSWKDTEAYNKDVPHCMTSLLDA